MKRNSALDAAVALARSPRLCEGMARRPLPSGVDLVLRLLARDDRALDEAQMQTRLDASALATIAELYVLRILLERGAAPHRVLGVERGADRARSRRHMGYLLMWLHPDRNADAWRAALAGRVIDAWRRIDRETSGENRKTEPPRLQGGWR
jgi:hypothetical protein